MRGLFDAANLLMIGYPVALMTGFWLFPDLTGIFMLIGAAIAVPMFLLQRRGEPIDPNRPKYGFPWFRLLLVGVSFSWPFILATVAGWWSKKRRKHRESIGE